MRYYKFHFYTNLYVPLSLSSTEFHVKFLWGSSGATAKAEDRHGKLEKVLTLMADKFCSVSA